MNDPKNMFDLQNSSKMSKKKVHVKKISFKFNNAAVDTLAIWFKVNINCNDNDYNLFKKHTFIQFDTVLQIVNTYLWIISDLVDLFKCGTVLVFYRLVE